MSVISIEDKITAAFIAGFCPLVACGLQKYYSMPSSRFANIVRCILYPAIGFLCVMGLADSSKYWAIIPLINFFAACFITPGIFGNSGVSGAMLAGLIPLTLGFAAVVQYGIADGKIVV
jgi:uncharacterized membrane protein (GlpM family)